MVCEKAKAHVDRSLRVDAVDTLSKYAICIRVLSYCTVILLNNTLARDKY